MEGVVLPLLQPVAEDPDPDVRCRAVQLLTHLVTEASPTWAAQSLAIISSVSVCVCVRVSMHVVCVCVCVRQTHPYTIFVSLRCCRRGWKWPQRTGVIG